MTGPWHYREAERLIELAQETDDETVEIYAEAQVHATLAVAAATANQPSAAPADSLMRRAWAAITGPFVGVATEGSRP
ncbi:hypothetical protein [Streptomyces silaceus]|uniref:hypothetical protein n=1 Tax=Streptomyces silaceus TaxID=545123 RepID=UPI0006EBD423|nr:hypothetical protein [Streptomyces silaceus]